MRNLEQEVNTLCIFQKSIYLALYYIHFEITVILAI